MNISNQNIQPSVPTLRITVKQFIRLLFKRSPSDKFFLKGDATTEEYRSRLYTDEQTALLLRKHVGPDGDNLRIEPPFSEYNPTDNWCVYLQQEHRRTIEHHEKLKEQQRKTQSEFALRQSLLKSLILAMHERYPDAYPLDPEGKTAQLAQIVVMSKNIPFASMFGVDLSLLSDHITIQTTIIDNNWYRQQLAQQEERNKQ